MKEWQLTEVENGFILSQRDYDPYNPGGINRQGKIFVFNDAIQLSNWIRRNLKKDTEKERDTEHTEK